MAYAPTREDLQILKGRSVHTYCKVDLLNLDMVTIDSLEGLVMDGSLSIDADADIRRTFNSTIFLDEGENISELSTEEWINKYVRVYLGLKTRDGTIKWWPQGVYVFNQNGFSYSSSQHTLSISCVDLVAKLDGSLGGQLVGYKTEVEINSNIRNAIIATLKLSGLNKHMIDYWDRVVPYTLEYDTGVTIWEILTELRDLYYPFEMYFDDDTFVCKEIPSGFDDPSVLDAEIFANFVISEDASVDYSVVKNCVEVWGAVVEADYYSENVTYGNGVLVVNLTNADLTYDQKISFVLPQNITETQISIQIENRVVTEPTEGEDGEVIPGSEQTVTVGPFVLYESLTNEEGEDVVQDPSIMREGKYYVVEFDHIRNVFYFIGQQQAHAMVKLVDRMPTPEEVIQQQQEENCDNLKFICLNDPANIDKLYNSRFTIEQIGQRNKILSGGSYDNYKNDNSAMEVCEYEHWKSCRLTDTVTVNTVLIPWLDVNQKLSYAAKYLKTDLPVEFLIKKIDMTLGDGTMNITLSRYYPYYPYIVDNKYADDGRIRRA